MTVVSFSLCSPCRGEGEEEIMHLRVGYLVTSVGVSVCLVGEEGACYCRESARALGVGVVDFR